MFFTKIVQEKYIYNANLNYSLDIISAANQIKATSGLFTDQCKSLKDFEIPKELMFALVCQILNINLELPKDNQLKKKINSLQNLIELTKVLTSRYTNELGSNAYAAFNVVTDLVSHQDQYRNLTGYYFNVRSYFSKPTDWMDDFSNHTKVKSFVYTDYLKETIDRLERIRKHTELEWELN